MNHIITDERLIRAISAVSDIQDNYKRINYQLMCCYNVLPESLSKIAIFLFMRYLSNMMYGDEAIKNGKMDNLRIFVTKPTDIEDIAKNIYPVKYYKNLSSLTYDKSNIIQRLKQLDENNIIYVWQCKKSRLYIIEREFFAWKYFNSMATIPLKTLKKILNIYKLMIRQMEVFIKSKENDFNNLIMIEKSFGSFINRIIMRLPQFISQNLMKWDGVENIHEYIQKLNAQVNKYNNLIEGISVHVDFFKKIPPEIVYNINENYRKNGETDMKKESSKLAKELVPSTPHISRRKVGLFKKEPSVIEQVVEYREPMKPNVLAYSGDIDPFSNSRQFVRFYRAFLENAMGKVKFEKFDYDVIDATAILDKLTDSHRNNIVFLNAWLKFFVDNYLKGDKKMKIKYTRIKALAETLNEFNEKFYLSL